VGKQEKKKEENVVRKGAVKAVERNLRGTILKIG